ncbi:MAG: dTDP-glucose 4,6-dehydratase [Hyphomicrobiales bacterium]
MRVLVTGGAGFVGSAVCRDLIARGCKVINIDKLTYAANPDAIETIADHPHYSFHQLDICQRADVAAVFDSEQPDAVIHLAAESHVDRSISEPAAFINTNVVGTYHLLEAALGYWQRLPAGRRDQFRFLHISTDEVFGSLGNEGTFSETTPYDPASPYSASKAASDHLALAWYRTYGMPVLLANCCNNYGPYQFPEKLIPLIITNAVLGKALPVYGDGRNVRDWIYVDDHARALASILERGAPGERYNIGARSEHSNLVVVNAICTYLDECRPRAGSHYRDQIEFVADRPGHDFRYAISPDKVEREIGWQPQESFESGLAKTIDWYLTNESWWKAIRARGYDGERLGLLDERRTDIPITAAASPEVGANP